ncbi:hypothetical protein ScPMuIL_013099 [Solemya velum]
MAQCEQTKEGNVTIYKKRVPRIDSKSILEVSRQVEVDERDQKIIAYALSFAATGKQGDNLELHIILVNTKVELILTSGDCEHRVLIHLDSEEKVTDTWERKGLWKHVVDGLSWFIKKGFEMVIRAIIDKLVSMGIDSACKQVTKFCS